MIPVYTPIRLALATACVFFAASVFTGLAWTDDSESEGNAGSTEGDRGSRFVDGMFNRMDADGDGVVTKDEFKASVKKKMGHMRKAWHKRHGRHHDAGGSDSGHHCRKATCRSCAKDRHHGRRPEVHIHHHYYGRGPHAYDHGRHDKGHHGRRGHFDKQRHHGSWHGDKDGKGRRHHRHRRGGAGTDHPHKEANLNEGFDTELELTEGLEFDDLGLFEAENEDGQPQAAAADSPVDGSETDDATNSAS